jgi:hypothetical protein
MKNSSNEIDILTLRSLIFLLDLHATYSEDVPGIRELAKRIKTVLREMENREEK